MRVRGWDSAVTAAVDIEDTMANKDKGSKSTKKVAARDLKQKRLDKKAKKDDADRKSKSKVV
jgi:hypothetical protein